MPKYILLWRGAPLSTTYTREHPGTLVCDNGPEFTQNVLVESFHGKSGILAWTSTGSRI